MTALRSAGPASATRRDRAGLAVLALPTAMTSFDVGALFLALPQLGTALRASSTQLLWITDAHRFVVAGCLVTMGSAGDRVGRRRLLTVGASAFAVLSDPARASEEPLARRGRRSPGRPVLRRDLADHPTADRCRVQTDPATVIHREEGSP